MKIYCKDCKKYVGEIRDASLMKGLVYQCPSCNNAKAHSDFLSNDYTSKQDFGKIFNDIFSKNK